MCVCRGQRASGISGGYVGGCLLLGVGIRSKPALTEICVDVVRKTAACRNTCAVWHVEEMHVTVH